ncbi:MAG: helix-turn-helix domain-containing protein [Oscillospiraceae bacterium]|nr:helix-turn-helix domain-containing protein [Oscillospiraceae bacterium]
MELRDRLNLFQDMVQSCHNLHLWEYDRELSLIRSNCPFELAVRNLFAMGGARELLLDYVKKHNRPIIMTNSLGMMWAAIPEKQQGEPWHIHILGPFFTNDRSTQELERELKKYRLSPDMLPDVMAFLRSLPVISLSRAFEYTIMLYFCITGEKIAVSDLHYQESETVQPANRKSHKTDLHGTYEMEQEMIRMVREGNLGFQSHMNRLAVSGSMGTLANNDNTRQMKNAVLVCIVLFSRAAIEGGVSPEVALTLTDHYFQSVEASRSLTELKEIALTMQNDFVQRVHKVRSSRLSKPVLDCCDYINMHLEEKLNLRELAERFRYSETYLSRKFRSETGLSFKEYVRHQRLEQAKTLLQDSSLDIHDISDRLHFCSPSYFAEQFRAEFGISPTQWRSI